MRSVFGAEWMSLGELKTYEKSLMFGLQRVMFVSHKRLKGGKFKNKWGVVVQHQNEITRLII